MSKYRQVAWTRAAPNAGSGSDLYLDWGIATGWAGQALKAKDLWLPLLAPVDDRWREFTARLDPVLYRVGDAPETGGTAASPEEPDWGVLWIPSHLAAQALEALPEAEASQPRRALLPRPEKLPAPVAPSGSDEQPRLVMAAIDAGGAFLNKVFRYAHDGTRTRFAAIWDQDQDAHPESDHWSIPAAGYGRELRGDTLQALCAQADSQRDGERITYAKLGLDDLLLSEALGRADHATHVLDTLAGLPPSIAPAACSKPDLLDAAAQAPLILVSTPGVPDGQTTGTPTLAQVVEGLHYIVARAAELGGPNCPVVVNISLGMLGGPHDGSSALERALDALMQRHPQLLVVLAAGNTGDVPEYDFAGTLEPKASASLIWRLQPHDPTDSFFELWWTGARPAELKVRVVHPYRSGWVSMGSHCDLHRGPNLWGRLALQARDEGLQATSGHGQLSLGPVEGPRGGLPAGQWRLEVRNDGVDLLHVRGWVQGDHPRWTLEAPVQSRLDGASGSLELGAAGSLNGLATGRLPRVVGAARGDDDHRSTYSSQPSAAGGRTIDALALADEGAVARGLVAAGVLSGTWVRMSGTSVAAPVAARHWAQDLFEGHTATDLRDPYMLQAPAAPAWMQVIRPTRRSA